MTLRPVVAVAVLGGFTIAMSTIASAATIVEYYWPNGDNFFITADSNEIASLDAASAASGKGPDTWNRTGVTFGAGGPDLACRFFGNTNVNPTTHVTFGPNSHFYTLF